MGTSALRASARTLLRVQEPSVMAEIRANDRPRVGGSCAVRNTRTERHAALSNLLIREDSP
jgi:hypothetical protein